MAVRCAAVAMLLVTVGCAAGSAVEVAPGVRLQRVTAHYDIAASSFEEARARAEQTGPSRLGAPHASYTDVSFTWRQWHQWNVSFCYVTAFEVTATLLRQLPRWAHGPQGAQVSPEARRAFDAYVERLGAHEDKRERAVIAFFSAGVARVEAMRSERSCADLHEEIVHATHLWANDVNRVLAEVDGE